MNDGLTASPAFGQIDQRFLRRKARHQRRVMALCGLYSMTGTTILLHLGLDG